MCRQFKMHVTKDSILQEKIKKEKIKKVERDAVIFLNKDAQDICIDFRVINVFIITRQPQKKCICYSEIPELGHFKSILSKCFGSSIRSVGKCKQIEAPLNIHQNAEEYGQKGFLIIRKSLSLRTVTSQWTLYHNVAYTFFLLYILDDIPSP